MIIIRCFKGLFLTFLVFLFPLILLQNQYYLGENLWQFLAVLSVVFFSLFLLYGILMNKKYLKHIWSQMIVLFLLFIFFELIFYYLPESFTQFYYIGNRTSTLMLFASAIPAGLLTRPIFSPAKSLVIIQEEI